MKHLIILRGIPGCGKSFYARKLCSTAYRLYKTFKQSSYFIICSADNFFEDKYTEKYNFDSKLLPRAHAYCKGNALLAMAAGNNVIIDNTNTRHWEYADYLKMAKECNYKVKIKIIGDFDEASILKYAERNTHGVPLEVVKAMAERFEK